MEEEGGGTRGRRSHLQAYSIELEHVSTHTSHSVHEDDAGHREAAGANNKSVARARPELTASYSTSGVEAAMVLLAVSNTSRMTRSRGMELRR